jgi:hypothetical protein
MQLYYADEALSKWNEIDELFEEEKQQQKALIEAGLDKLGITEPYQRDFAMKKVDEAHKHVKSNWQLEKAQRIKPSLWWKKVAEAQAQNQTTSTEQSEANTAKLSNLSADGKAWFIHPVAMMDYFSGAGIVTYHIYHDGKIEKHIPQEILEGYEQKYKYIYHDKDDNEHEICICEWHTINKKLCRNATTTEIKAFTYPNYGSIRDAKKLVEEEEIYARAIYMNGDIHEWIRVKGSISIYQRLTMTNGNIAEYGYHSKKRGYIWRVYEAQSEKTKLIRMPNHLNYVNGNTLILYQLVDTYRRYTNPDLMAGFIGALAEIKTNVKVTGSAYKQGSCFPSALHINGESIDTHYFSQSTDSKKREKDKQFINSLYKFHFKIFRVGSSFKEIFKGIHGCIDGGELHDTHLHIEQFENESITNIP